MGEKTRILSGGRLLLNSYFGIPGNGCNWSGDKLSFLNLLNQDYQLSQHRLPKDLFGCCLLVFV